MLYLANPCGDAVIAQMEAGTLGFIDTPAQGNKRPADIKWCADNGSFSDKFDEAKWWRFLTDNASDAGTCLFAVAPDVVGDAAATLDRSLPWLPRIRALGYPAAFVAQNGQENLSVPWDEFDCLFIGGSLECVPCGYVYREKRKPKRNEPCPLCARVLTEWKLGDLARDLCHEAKQRGKWVHVGRVNSGKRYAYAAMPYENGGMGADSADGTYLTRGPRVNLPKLLEWGNDLFTIGEFA